MSVLLLSDRRTGSVAVQAADVCELRPSAWGGADVQMKDGRCFEDVRDFRSVVDMWGVTLAPMSAEAAS